MVLVFIQSPGILNPKFGKNWMTWFLHWHSDLASWFTNRLDKEPAFATTDLWKIFLLEYDALDHHRVSRCEKD